MKLTQYSNRKQHGLAEFIQDGTENHNRHTLHQID